MNNIICKSNYKRKIGYIVGAAISLFIFKDPGRYLGVPWFIWGSLLFLYCVWAFIIDFSYFIRINENEIEFRWIYYGKNQWINGIWPRKYRYKLQEIDCVQYSVVWMNRLLFMEIDGKNVLLKLMTNRELFFQFLEEHLPKCKLKY